MVASECWVEFVGSAAGCGGASRAFYVGKCLCLSA
jgi:hypothetical protein